MKVRKSNKYIGIEEMEAIDFNENLYETEIDAMKKRVLEKMQEKSVPRKRAGIKVAAIVAACAILLPTSVYAANRLNLFGNLFGGADETPVGDYVEFATDAIVSEDTQEKSYADANDTYEITADYCMYNEATGAGVLQFTITNKTGDGRQWYEIATVDEYYEDWEIGTRDVPEIYAVDNKGQLSFEVEGLGKGSHRVFLKESESDANKKVCIIVFNGFKQTDSSAADLKLVVKERQNESGVTTINIDTILTVDIPKGESVPTLKWADENGNGKVVLSSFDFFVYGITDGGQTSSVKFKDGSEYHIQNDEKKVINELYGTISYEGLWDSFCTIIDLNEVEAFYFDGAEYPASDAVME